MTFMTDEYDATIGGVWRDVRLLEQDLERLAADYGLECNGLGFAALAHALTLEGWVRGAKPRLIVV